VPQLLQAGIAIPKEVIDYAPIPADLAAKWKETLSPSPEVQQKGALELQGLQLDNAVKDAKAKKDQADAAKTMAELQRPQENGAAAAAVKAQADVRIAEMEAAIEERLFQLQSNREAQTEILIAKLKLDNEVEIARLKGLIDLKIGAMNAATQAKIAANKPAPAAK
jgi:hypothetical protein